LENIENKWGTYHMPIACFGTNGWLKATFLQATVNEVRKWLKM
jgi:hypothetical protein